MSAIASMPCRPRRRRRARRGLVADRLHVVPVAAEPERRRRGQVARRDRQAGDRRHVGQRPALQLEDEFVLALVQLGALDGLGGEVGDGEHPPGLVPHRLARAVGPQEHEQAGERAGRVEQREQVHPVDLRADQRAQRLVLVDLGAVGERHPPTEAEHRGQRSGRVGDDVVEHAGPAIGRARRRPHQPQRRVAGVEEPDRDDRRTAGRRCVGDDLVRRPRPSNAPRTAAGRASTATSPSPGGAPGPRPAARSAGTARRRR